MKSRFSKTYILLGIFVALLLFVVFFENEGADRQRRESRENEPVFTEQQLADVEEVIFTRPGFSGINSVRKTEEGNWKILDYDVDPDEADNLMEALKSFGRGKRVARNADNWESYGVSGSGKDLTLSAEGINIARVYFGNTAPSRRSYYVRFEDDDSVYEVKTELESFFQYDLARWRDKRLVPVPAEELATLTVRVGEEKWAFSQANGEWSQATDTGSVLLEDQEAMLAYVDDLLNLEGTGFETDQSLYEQADNAIAYIDASGVESVVFIDKKSDQDIFAQLSGEEHLVRLPSDFSARLKPAFLTESEEISEEVDLPEPIIEVDGRPEGEAPSA